MKCNSQQFNNFEMSQKNQSNVVTLFDCFLYNQKTENFTGQNQNYCNICKQLGNSIIHLKYM